MRLPQSTSESFERSDSGACYSVHHSNAIIVCRHGFAFLICAELRSWYPPHSDGAFVALCGHGATRPLCNFLTRATSMLRPNEQLWKGRHFQLVYWLHWHPRDPLGHHGYRIDRHAVDGKWSRPAALPLLLRLKQLQERCAACPLVPQCRLCVTLDIYVCFTWCLWLLTFFNTFHHFSLSTVRLHISHLYVSLMLCSAMRTCTCNCYIACGLGWSACWVGWGWHLFLLVAFSLGASCSWHFLFLIFVTLTYFKKFFKIRYLSVSNEHDVRERWCEAEMQWWWYGVRYCEVEMV